MRTLGRAPVRVSGSGEAGPRVPGGDVGVSVGEVGLATGVSHPEAAVEASVCGPYLSGVCHCLRTVGGVLDVSD